MEAVSKAAIDSRTPITERIEGLAAVGRWLEPSRPSLAMEKRDQVWGLASSVLDLSSFQDIETREAALRHCLQTGPGVENLAALGRRVNRLPSAQGRSQLLLSIAEAFVAAGDMTAGGITLGSKDDSNALFMARINMLTSGGEHEMARAELANLPLHSAVLPRAALKIALAVQDEAEIDRALQGAKEKMPGLPFDYQLGVVRELLAAKRPAEATDIARQMPSPEETHALLHCQPLLAVVDHYLALPEGRELARPILQELRTTALAVLKAADEQIEKVTDPEFRDHYLLYGRVEFEAFLDTIALKEIRSYITVQDASAAISAFEATQFNQTIVAENDPHAERLAAFAVALAEQGHMNEAVGYALRLPTGSNAICTSPKGRGLRSETFARLAQIHRKQRIRQTGMHITLTGPEGQTATFEST